MGLPVGSVRQLKKLRVLCCIVLEWHHKDGSEQSGAKVGISKV